jgi:hypothetical protein
MERRFFVNGPRVQSLFVEAVSQQLDGRIYRLRICRALRVALQANILMASLGFRNSQREMAQRSQRVSGSDTSNYYPQSLGQYVLYRTFALQNSALLSIVVFTATHTERFLDFMGPTVVP